MDAFSYLSVLLSIIVGLAITQVLQGYRALLLSRRRVGLYAPPLIWSATVLVIAVQSWWASFGLANRSEWDFATFALILFQQILLYMMAGVALPDVAPDQRIDLRDHYYRERGPLFVLLLALLATSLVKMRVLDGALPASANVLFHAVFVAGGAAALAVRRPRFHEVLAILVAVLMVAYITILFARL